MRLVHAHVAQAVDDDAGTDDADDERHDDREVVDVELVDHVDVLGNGKVEVEHEAELDDGERDGERLSVVDALDDDVEAQRDLDHERDVTDDRGRRVIDGEQVRLGRQELCRAEDASACDDERSHHGDVAARTIVAHEHQYESDEHGKQDEKRCGRDPDFHRNFSLPDSGQAIRFHT